MTPAVLKTTTRLRRVPKERISILAGCGLLAIPWRNAVMADNKFWDQYNDHRWKEVRHRIIAMAGGACEECGDTGHGLSVHHEYYETGLKIWEYPADSLHCLCDPCHSTADCLRRELKQILGQCSLDDMHNALGFIGGMFSGRHELTPPSTRGPVRIGELCERIIRTHQRRRERQRELIQSRVASEPCWREQYEPGHD